MHHNVYNTFYSHQHVSAAVAAIFNVMLLSQQHNGTIWLAVSPSVLNINIIMSVTFIQVI
jgi:hypothetical protein